MLRIALINLTIVFCLSVGQADAQNISDEARRHFDRGEAAIEMAKSPTDYGDAIKEFEQAMRLAPDWPDVYYNLGLLHEKTGNYDEAIQNLKQYLQLAPNESDAQMVKSLINKLEFKAEKTSEQARIPALLAGKWMGSTYCCGGERPTIQFLIVNDILTVRIPVTWDADRGQRTDYKSYPVETEGQTIRFGFKAKLLLRGLNDTSYCNMRYELKLINSNKLQGKVFNGGNSTETYFTKMH